ncbi:MAG: hypothetical protein KJ879_02545, partial [Nanoarchaeota archaeon]|nr:hypothetical protein [Nanoarchaeota archaeon]
ILGYVTPEQLVKISVRCNALRDQPPLEVSQMYIDKNPRVTRREICVRVRENFKEEYDVKDMGRADGHAEGQTLGQKVYYGMEVEELVKARLLSQEQIDKLLQQPRP